MLILLDGKKVVGRAVGLTVRTGQQITGTLQGVVANVAPAVKEMPMLEGFLPTPILVLVAFERWKDILKLPAPDSSLLITTAVWRFARGMAHAKLGKPDLAAREQSAWQAVVAKIPPDTMYDELNKTGAVFKIHEHLLSAVEHVRDRGCAVQRRSHLETPQQFVVRVGLTASGPI